MCIFIRLISVILFVGIVSGCNYHYYQAKDLDSKERWEEAAIEYRLAFVEDPDDEEIIESLDRVNKIVAEENYQRYQSFLNKKEYRKAYRRLEAILVQDPSLEKARLELPNWRKVLLAGKIQLELDQLRSNIRLADEMQLQIRFNTPINKQITANISNTTGFFFTEDILYKQELENLPHYTIDSIGLKLVKRVSTQRTKQEFKKFISFRGLISEPTVGQLELSQSPLKTVSEHRPQLLNLTHIKSDSWVPPRLIRYYLDLQKSEIRVVSEDRIEFMPNVLYVNNEQQRAFIDFGVSQLNLNTKTRLWSIQKIAYTKESDDYFYQFSQNLALYPYFFYKDGIYQYVPKLN